MIFTVAFHKDAEMTQRESLAVRQTHSYGICKKAQFSDNRLESHPNLPVTLPCSLSPTTRSHCLLSLSFSISYMH